MNVRALAQPEAVPESFETRWRLRDFARQRGELRASLAEHQQENAKLEQDLTRLHEHIATLTAR